MCENIIAGFIANSIFLITIILLGFLVGLTLRRSKLLKFFGIETTKKITIYLSTIHVTKGGSLGADGRPRAYEGIAVDFLETIQANSFDDLFSYKNPEWASQYDLLKKLFLKDIRVIVTPAPPNESDIDKHSTIISFGSPAYNHVSKWIESSLSPKMKFLLADSVMIVDGLPPINSGKQGFIQKIWDKDNKRWIFYAAGLSALGTIGAAHYLYSNWRKLHSDHSDKEAFSHLMSFDKFDYKNSKVII